MNLYKPLYICRLCHKQFYGGTPMDHDIAYSSLVTSLLYEKSRMNKHLVHDCPEGRYGIADLIGIEPVSFKDAGETMPKEDMVTVKMLDPSTDNIEVYAGITTVNIYNPATKEHKTFSSDENGVFSIPLQWLKALNG